MTKKYATADSQRVTEYAEYQRKEGLEKKFGEMLQRVKEEKGDRITFTDGVSKGNGREDNIEAIKAKADYMVQYHYKIISKYDKVPNKQIDAFSINVNYALKELFGVTPERFFKQLGFTREESHNILVLDRKDILTAILDEELHIVIIFDNKDGLFYIYDVDRIKKYLIDDSLLFEYEDVNILKRKRLIYKSDLSFEDLDTVHEFIVCNYIIPEVDKKRRIISEVLGKEESSFIAELSTTSKKHKRLLKKIKQKGVIICRKIMQRLV